MNSFTNLSNIFDKLESDEKLSTLGDFLTKMFNDEMVFAVQGYIKRIKKTEIYESSDQYQKAALSEFLNFQRKS